MYFGFIVIGDNEMYNYKYVFLDGYLLKVSNFVL